MKLRALLFALPIAALAVTACGDESRSTFDFSPEIVEAQRFPARAECNQFNAPNSDDDLFHLKAVEGNLAKLVAVQIDFKRKTPVGAELDAWSSNIPDHHPSISFTMPDGAQKKYVTRASVTVTDVPSTDGEKAGAQFEIEFVDGDFLEGSISAPVISSGGPCKTGP